MTEQSIQTDEINLIDILVTLTESWKLLVFGPLVAGVLAGGLSFLLPKTFESVAILRMSEEEVALLHAAPVLDPLIEKFGLLAEADGILEEARQAMKKRLTIAVDKKTKIVTIGAKARTPVEARSLAASAIENLLKELQPKGQERVLLEKMIAINDRALSSAEDAVESIQNSMKRERLSDLVQESTIKNLAVLNTDVAKISQDNEVLRQKLQSKGAEIFIQEPSLPQQKVSPKRSLVVISAIIISGFILLIYVFVDFKWRSMLHDQKIANKIHIIKNNFK